MSGCTRARYRQGADAQSYTILGHKSWQTPWHLPSHFTIQPDPRARFFDPTPIDNPILPPPLPKLYQYVIPPLDCLINEDDDRDDKRKTKKESEPEELPVPYPGYNASEYSDLPPPPPGDPSAAASHSASSRDSESQFALYQDVGHEAKTSGGNPPKPGQPADLGNCQVSFVTASPDSPLLMVADDDTDDGRANDPPEPRRLPLPDDVENDNKNPPRPGDVSSEEAPPENAAGKDAADENVDRDREAPRSPGADVDDVAGGQFAPPPVPSRFWEALPESCMARMLEFSRVREEYRSSFRDTDKEPRRDTGERLTLREIVALALLNSREYQTQKETLYRAALALTLERFDYVMKFSTSGNNTAVDYSNTRVPGSSQGQLNIPTNLQADKTLITAGSLLAQFANSVVLTFNSPEGFTADVVSQLFFDVSQTVFQRDIVFEPLTQSERDVVYAARDFARFRKTFFFGLTNDYYALLRNYRQIEIDAQNYFSLVRALNQAEAEEEAGLQSRIQVEQIEQSMLQGRSSLISSCNRLENGIDRLKISIGIPTETLIDIDLIELEELTLRDEAAVAENQVQRATTRLRYLRDKDRPERTELVNAAIVLIERVLEWARVQRRLERDVPDLTQLRVLHAQLRIDAARLIANDDLDELEKDRNAETPAPPVRLFQRVMDLAESLLELIAREVDLGVQLDVPREDTEEIMRKQQQLADHARDLRERLTQAIDEADLDALVELQLEAERLLEQIQDLLRQATSYSGEPSRPQTAAGELKKTLADAAVLLNRAEEFLSGIESGLLPIDITVDDAMMTALTQRLDLMNERGTLGDDRRAVKLTGDDLKSILNLNANYRINTEKNRVADFDFDDSRLNLSMSLDLPLNRRAQRNGYRRSLIDYNAALRSLMALEDTVKLGVRDDLRSLSLDRVQYQIAVASAALAAERVLSTSLELRLGFPGVAARDFLEAQDAFRNALSGVADNHIGYLVDRTQFFLDLELLQVDDTGFWDELYDEDYQPEPRYTLPYKSGPAYGKLAPRVKYSWRMKRIFKGTNYGPDHIMARFLNYVVPKKKPQHQ